IHDEVGVLIRKRCSSDASALQPGALEEPTREPARRILEDRPGVGYAAGLARHALRMDLGHARPQFGAIATGESEFDPGDYESRRQRRAPLRKPDLLLGQRFGPAAPGYAMNQGHDLGDSSTECAGVHHQPAPDTAGNSFAELQTGQSALDY